MKKKPKLNKKKTNNQIMRIKRLCKKNKIRKKEAHHKKINKKIKKIHNNI